MNEHHHALEQRVAHLETTLTLLQQHLQNPAGMTVQAPFRVINDQGQRLLEIDQQAHDIRLRLFNADGRAVMTIGVDGTHAGYLGIRNAEGTLVAAIDVEQSGARLIVSDHARGGGVVLFGSDSGDDVGGGLHIMHTSNEISASLWATDEGAEFSMRNPQTGEAILTLPDSIPHGNAGTEGGE